MRFVVDAQLPPALARFLASLGEEAIHVLDAGLLEADDGEIWSFALANDWVIITKDDDFQFRASVSPNKHELEAGAFLVEVV
jgi:predicted nuclease of predicted toxin-antitoxin system